MSTHIPKIIEKNIVKLQSWLYDIEDIASISDTTEALFVLRAVLHQLRDNLPITHIAHLNAQLPLVIAGLFFEGWNGHIEPYKERNEETFLKSVDEALTPHTILPAEKAVAAVFSVLKGRLGKKTTEKLQNVLPKAIRVYFDQ